MNIQLTNLRQIEALNNANLYQGLSSAAVLPGQQLLINTQRAEIISCEAIANGFRLNLILPADTAVEDVTETTLTGTAFLWQDPIKRPWLLTDDSGLMTAIHWCHWWRQQHPGKQLHSQVQGLILDQQGSAIFRAQPSKLLTPDLPDEMIASIGLFDDWGLVSRICSPEFRPGCFEASLVELIQAGHVQPKEWLGFGRSDWLDHLAKAIGPAITTWVCR